MSMPKPADPTEAKPAPATLDPSLLGGAVGVGSVLVLLPGASLFFGMHYLDAHPSFGLPIMAVFGIMMLVGTLALTSTLFSRLGLARRSEPLAMPPGSVRATIALALIVLFAIVASTEPRPAGSPYELHGVSADARNEIAKDGKLMILATVTESCARTSVATTPPALPRDVVPAASAAQAAAASVCAAADQRFTVVIQPGPSPASVELAKQLQAQIVQLLSTVVAFYFATRAMTKSTTPAPAPAPAPAPSNAPAPAPAPVAAAPAADTHDDHVDGCNVPITNPTLDHELPAAQGGVVPK